MNKRKSRISLNTKKSIVGYIFILPWLIGFLLFFLNPILTTISFSFRKIEVTAFGFNEKFIGLENFRFAFTEDPDFPRFLTASMTDLLADVPVLLIFSLFAALLLYQKFKGVGAVKTIFFLTVILSSGIFLKVQAETMYVNSMQMNAAMQEGSGQITILQSVNIQRFLLEAGISQQIISYITTPIDRIFQVIMKSGIQVFIFLAGLNAISPSIYEASYIEGATGWETFWKITFPMISPLILVNVVYTVIDSFMSYTNRTLFYINVVGLGRLNLGYASAMAWIYFLTVGIILIVVMGLISKKIFYQN